MTLSQKKIYSAISKSIGATCNMSCEYCYVPGKQILKDIHKDIEQSYIDGSFIDDIKEMNEGHLDSLGLWGTEPTLMLKHIKNHVGRLLDTFPDLDIIQFSSNFYDTKDLFPFIMKLAEESDKRNRRFRLGVQVSLDGPPIYQNTGRRDNSYEKIVENIKKLVDDISKHNKDYNRFRLSLGYKSTLHKDNMNELALDINKYIEWCKVYDNLYDYYDRSENKKEFFGFHIFAQNPTIVVPGDYTSQDGRDFAQLMKTGLKIMELKKAGMLPSIKHRMELNGYLGRTHRTLKAFSEVMVNPKGMSCSAGVNSICLDDKNNINMCQRTLYTGIKEVHDTTSKESVRISHDHVKQIVVPKDDLKEVNRFSYVMTGQSLFNYNKISYIIAQLKHLATLGLADNHFLTDENYLFISAVIIADSTSCPAEQYLQTGSVNLIDLGRIILHANGYTRVAIDEYAKLYGRTLNNERQ